MKLLSVWAPETASVDAVLASGRVPMQPAEHGWWTTTTPVAAGTDYHFSVDGGEPVPDPRSPWQPAGVHGASRVLDHDDFAWTDSGWQAPPLASAVIYELHVGTFTPDSTFDAAIARLDHLVRLGVTHVEIMPVNEFPGRRGWGYDGVDLFAPHHGYGGPEGLKRLIDACHGRGLAVLIDVVYNHLGPSGNYLARFGPYFTSRYHTPWGDAVNLDGPGSDGMRRFICDNALMWLRDYHADGLRLDAVHAFIDTSAVHILEQLAAEVDALEATLGRHLVLIAESDLNDPRVVRGREAGGHGMDAQWSDDFHHALHVALTGERGGYYEDFESLRHLAEALEHTFVYRGTYSAHRRRTHGRPPDGLPPARFVHCMQNHDQVGNRAGGERSSHLMSVGRLKIAAALVLVPPYVPLLFQGEEWGATAPFQYFTEHEDPGLGRAVSEGRRREFAGFGWQPEDVPDPQAPETFLRSRLDWSETAREPHA
ncbi:MAG TPA: malto-oligosyltrehalose trehalohydrolase, partial [Candidatus Limnocylindria bacterium]|nr:malto-oligosyltrehalose trehalohydrolase [Candidatus Limnocylindria bacterium]